MEGGREGKRDKEGREKFSYNRNQQYTFLGFLLYLYRDFTEQYGTVGNIVVRMMSMLLFGLFIFSNFYYLSQLYEALNEYFLNSLVTRAKYFTGTEKSFRGWPTNPS